MTFPCDIVKVSPTFVSEFIMPLLTTILLVAACISNCARLFIVILPDTLFTVALDLPLRVNVPLISVPASPLSTPLFIETLPEIMPL